MTDQAVQCGFTKLHGTPVFAIAPGIPQQSASRVLGAMFSAEHSLWFFPAFYPYIKDVVRDLKIVFGEDLEFSEAAKKEIDECDIVETALDKQPMGVALHPGFKFITQPFEHQESALKFALYNIRCGILYDMGLGKTKIAIDLIRYLKRYESALTLILTPVIGIKMWQREIEKHAAKYELRVVALTGTGKSKKSAKLDEAVTLGANILIVGYDTAKRYATDIIQKFPYTIIIADESHNLRARDSERTKAACYLAARAYRRIIMSGTPSLGNPLHLFGQLQFLGKFIPATSFWTFRKIYTVSSAYNRKFIVGFKNLDHLNDKVRRICLRKTKEECLDLPPRVIIDEPFQVTGEQRDMYNQLVTEACTSLGEGKLYEAPHAAAVLQKLLQVLSGMFIVPPPDICDGCVHLQICVEEAIKPYTRKCVRETVPPPQAVKRLKENPKLDVLAELLDQILAEERNKVIVWAYFKAELDMIEEFLVAQNISYIRVDGSNSSKGQDFATKFNEDKTIRVWLGQIATGVALTLTAAQYMVYYALSWNLDQYLQSMDRNYRVGQTEKVFVYRLICENSVVDYLARCLAQKVDVANTLTDRIDCVFCRQEKDRDCLAKGIKPFEKGCAYKDKVKRIVTRPEML